MTDNAAKVQQLKEQGNKCMEEGKLDEALEHYDNAIDLDIKNHVLFSNRSAAHAKLGKYEEALQDAETTLYLKPDWSKGYSRKGTALLYLHRNKEALEAFQSGLALDANNQQLKDGLVEAKRRLQEGYGGPGGSLFDDPSCYERLRTNPLTKGYMEDPDFCIELDNIRKNPQSLKGRMYNKKLLTCLSVMAGLNSLDPESDDDADMDFPANSTSSGFPPRNTPPPPHATSREERMDVDKTPKQISALKEKEAGNAAYKKKEFEAALDHYNKAIELDPRDMTFLNNKAAVYFEQQKYQECIDTCNKAVETGRENRADFKLIAKAFTRIGNAYKALKDYGKAKIFYEKSLSEHRTPETRELLSKVEKLIKEHERVAYIDPAKAEEEKEKGNELFRKGDYPAAIRHYSEAIRRNPDDAKIYSNRAACYTKLAEFNLGLKDCDECIRLEPNFVKGYVRKGKILQGLKQYSKSQDAYQKAIDIDANCQDALDGFRECMMAMNSDPEEVRKRAMADPEVQQILKDPAMRMILEQMQTDPRALQDHLKNPEIASKIQKLLQSGLISIR